MDFQNRLINILLEAPRKTSTGTFQPHQGGKPVGPERTWTATHGSQISQNADKRALAALQHRHDNAPSHGARRALERQMADLRARMGNT